MRALPTWLLMSFCILAWGTAFPLIGYGLRHFEPLPLAFGRFGIAAIIAFAFLAWNRPPLPSPKDLAMLAFCGATGIGLYAALLNYGQTHMQAGLASFITGVNPLLTLILAVLFLGEKAGRFLWAGTFISILGVILIAASRGAFENGFAPDKYMALVMGSAAFGAVATVLQKPLLTRMSAVTQGAYVLIFGALALSPFAYDFIMSFAIAPLPQQLSVVYMGIFPAFLAVLAFVTLMERVGAARASSIIFAVPFFATIIGFFLLDQTIGWLGLAGGLVALCGVIFARR